jgi:DNA-binding transcriptional regulator GbsR (MarR family)
MSKPTAIRAIRELERRNMIRVTRRIGKNSVYFLTPPSQWVVKKKERTSKNEVTLPVKNKERKDIHKGYPKKEEEERFSYENREEEDDVPF